MAFHHRKLNSLNFMMPNGSDYAPAFSESDCLEFCDQKDKGKVCVYPTCIDYCPDLCKTPPSPSPKSPGLSLLLTISLSALAAAFFIFTCYTIYKLYSSWRRRRRQQSLRQDDGGVGPDEFLDQDQGPVADHHIWYIRTIGLQPAVIGAITIVKYKKGDGLVDGTDCSVCLSEFQEDETLRLLPKCNHAFHVACIDTWLRSHTNCPMCRAGIVAASARLSEQAVRDSGLGPNPEDGNGDGDEEPAELRIGIEEDEMVSGPKTLRRSISVDALSDRKLDNNQLVGVIKETGAVAKRAGLLRLIGGSNSSNERSTGSSSMKRSHSCSANVFLSRNRS